MLITNRDINLEVLKSKSGEEYLQWKFGYKESLVTKELYKKSSKSTIDGKHFPNTKSGRILAKSERAEAIINFEKDYVYELGSDMRDITFKQYSEVFLKLKSRVTQPNTIVSYMTIFKRFGVLDNIKLKDITRTQIEALA